jgi:hypothetical protein
MTSNTALMVIDGEDVPAVAAIGSRRAIPPRARSLRASPAPRPPMSMPLCARHGRPSRGGKRYLHASVERCCSRSPT